MSLRTTSVVLALIVSLGGLGCGGGGGGGTGKKSARGEPQTAKEKQLQEAKAAGETDGGQAKWGKWRYSGDRNDCFYVVGKKCFKTEAAACQALKCKGGEKCRSSGGGPATMSCRK
jgi:hypothetical protein